MRSTFAVHDPARGPAVIGVSKPRDRCRRRAQVRVGARYEFVRLQAFAGTGTPLHGAPALTAGPTPNAGLNPYNNVVYFSLRYYPFN